MNTCSYKAFESCHCTDTCQSETAELTLLIARERKAHQERAVADFGFAMFGILGAIVAVLMAYASVQMERMERENSLINQEAYAHVNRN